MAQTVDDARPWEVHVTSTDSELIQSLGGHAPQLDIKTGPIRRLPGITDTTVLQILGFIRDAAFNLDAKLLAAWLCLKARTPPRKPSGPRRAPRPKRRTRIRAHLRICDTRRSLVAEIDIDAESEEEIRAAIDKGLRDAGLSG